MAMVMEQLRFNRGGQFVGEEQHNPRRNGVILEEKYFRRVAAFEGDFAKFRGWLFDLNVAIGQVDKDLAGELERLVKIPEQDKWKPEEDRSLRRDLYDKYKSELYGILCSVTQGEPKNIVRSIVDAHSEQDGFRAFGIKPSIRPEDHCNSVAGLFGCGRTTCIQECARSVSGSSEMGGKNSIIV